MNTLRPFIAAGLLIILVGIATPASAEQMVFRGRMMTGNVSAPSATVKITYEGPSSPERLRDILTAMSGSGFDAFIGEMQKTKVGNIQFIGGTGLRIDLYMAFEKKTEKGVQILLVSESQKADPNSRRTLLGSNYLLVLQLDLDENYNGEGRITEDTVIRFSAAGDIEIESYRSTPKMIVNVRKQ